jgi:hypothetical protein
MHPPGGVLQVTDVASFKHKIPWVAFLLGADELGTSSVKAPSIIRGIKPRYRFGYWQRVKLVVCGLPFTRVYTVLGATVVYVLKYSIDEQCVMFLRFYVIV